MSFAFFPGVKNEYYAFPIDILFFDIILSWYRLRRQFRLLKSVLIRILLYACGSKIIATFEMRRELYTSEQL